MNYRTAEMMAATDLGPSGTHIMDINVADPISRLTILHEPLGASFIPAEHPISNIIRLEIIDGSDILYGMTGRMGQALNIFDGSNPPISQLIYMTGQPSMVALNVDFGRYLWDTELAFDPKRFTNPQLRLQWNEANYQALCIVHNFLIYAHTFDEKKITPMGFLSAKEIKAYTPAAGSFNYTDLPTDRPIRKLIVQPYRLAGGPRGLVDQYRLNEDNDKRVLFDGDLTYLGPLVNMEMGECEDMVRMNLAFPAGRAGYATASHLQVANAVNETAVNALSVVTAGNQVTVTPATAAANTTVRSKGVHPHACVSFPFGDQKDINDWYDVTKKGSVELRLRGGPAAVVTDTVRIGLQQLRRY